ncbi:MAG: PHB depolymerase family esterase [Variovorax sp.]
MNPLFQRLMKEATRLTRNGSLHAATEAIQRALHIGTPQTDRPQPASKPAPVAHEADVIEAEVRVIDSTSADVHADAEFAYVEPAEAAEIGEAGPEQWRDGSFAHGGRTLAYKLYLPPRAPGATATPMPLVLMLHGCSQNPADFAAGTRMNDLARAKGFAVLYPAQTQHANAQGCWNWFKPQHQQRGRGEPALLAALTQFVTASEAIDPARVYVAGLSAGGAMADILGRGYPELFAAVGVHSGLPTGAATDVMSALGAMRNGAARPPPGNGTMPPVIVFHGDADSTVHPRNGAAVVSAARGADASDGEVSEGRSAAGRAFTRSDYPASEGRNAVEHWLLHGTGHAWSGGSSQGSYTEPNGVDASAEMLRFFLAHPRAC